MPRPNSWLSWPIPTPFSPAPGLRSCLRAGIRWPRPKPRWENGGKSTSSSNPSGRAALRSSRASSSRRKRRRLGAARGLWSRRDSGRRHPSPISSAGRLAGPLEIRGLLRELRREKLEPLLAALADELARVHDRGLLHRDLSDGNILVEERAFGSPLDRGLNARASRAETDPQAKPGAPAGGESGEPAFRFFFLDTNRIRARRRLGAASRARNLVRLGVPPALQRFFLERYALARGRRLSFGFTLRYRLAKGMFSGWIGFKKKLRLKTLARKLKIQ